MQRSGTFHRAEPSLARGNDGQFRHGEEAVHSKNQQNEGDLKNAHFSLSGSADSAAAETMVPLSALAKAVNNRTAIQVNHQSGLIAAALSFNLPPGGSLSSAQAAIDAAMRALGAPAWIHGGFQGSVQVVAQSLSTIPLLILAALVAVYIVLGILYENTIHPITILSTLPSAGIGATLALLLFGVPFMGGLLLSQIFTLYTTPVIYLSLNRLRLKLGELASGWPWRCSRQPRSNA